MSWLTLALFGGVVGLDATSFPQVMISRPLVAASLSGLIMGDPLAGVAIGSLLEIFSLVILPFGASRYPESGTASVAATAAYVTASANAPGHQTLLLAVVFALTWEHVCGATVVFTRRVNERLVVGGGGDLQLSPAQVERRHLLAMLFDGLRGAWAVLIGAAVGTVLLQVFGPMLTIRHTIVVGFLLLGGSAMLGAALPMFGGFKQRKLSFGIGLLCGLLLTLLVS